MNILIAAVARNGVIGFGGQLPWSIPQDLQRFKALTTGHPVIMGRVTHESIGHALPDRTNIVLSRDPDYRSQGIEPASSVDAALDIARERHGGDTDLYVIGGSNVYEQLLPRADRLELTIVDSEPQGDAWFPVWDPTEWVETALEAHEGTPGFEFRTLERQAQA